MIKKQKKPGGLRHPGQKGGELVYLGLFHRKVTILTDVELAFTNCTAYPFPYYRI